jgi:hypothetical protein
MSIFKTAILKICSKSGEMYALSQYYDYINAFHGCCEISMGDARAYIGAKVDFIALENGINDADGLLWSLKEVLSQKNHLTKNALHNTLKKWYLTDKSSLKGVIHKSKKRIRQPTHNKKNDLHNGGAGYAIISVE